MSFLVNRKGQMLSENTIKWIIAIAIITAVGIAIRNIVIGAAG